MAERANYLRFEGGDLDGQTSTSLFPNWPPPDRLIIITEKSTGSPLVGDASQDVFADATFDPPALYYVRDPYRTSKFTDEQIDAAPVALARGAIYTPEANDV